MASSKLSSVVGGVLAVGLIAAAFAFRSTWLPWFGAGDEPAPAAAHDHAHGDRVKLSPQARANLNLTTGPLALQTYWRTLQVPASIIDRPGVSDRGVPTPVASVVAKVFAHPGDTVRPGDPLFSLKIISEYLQNAQTELFKSSQEILLNQAQLKRMRDLVQTGVFEQAKVVELQNQERRLDTQVKAYRQDLLTRGLTPGQIDAAAEGKFVSEIVIAAPPPSPNAQRLVEEAATAAKDADPSNFAYEVQELKVQLGEQVTAGQVLCVLANHRSLFIEGRGFKKEAALLDRAAQSGWPVEVEFAEDAPGEWPPLNQTFTIHHLGNTIDPESRTFAFFIPLQNQLRTYQRNERTFLVWRFRPGQRARLFVPVEEFKDVFVLPAGAVVKEGPDAYVFRENGDAFDRKPVRIVFEDSRNVVIANDGSISRGTSVARSSASALNRVLKAQQAGGEGGHDHHGHSH